MMSQKCDGSLCYAVFERDADSLARHVVFVDCVEIIPDNDIAVEGRRSLGLETRFDGDRRHRRCVG